MSAVRSLLNSVGKCANCINNRFGWVNASYVYGLQITSAHMRRALGTLTPYSQYAKATQLQDELDGLKV